MKTLAILLLITAPLAAQRQELGLTLGGVLSQTRGQLKLSGGTAFQANYGYRLDPKVYLIDHLPVRTSPMEFLLTIVIALAICITATLVPSWWAARLLPADGVRHE